MDRLSPNDRADVVPSGHEVAQMHGKDRPPLLRSSIQFSKGERTKDRSVSTPVVSPARGVGGQLPHRPNRCSTGTRCLEQVKILQVQGGSQGAERRDPTGCPRGWDETSGKRSWPS